jgi:hypothetical protein
MTDNVPFPSPKPGTEPNKLRERVGSFRNKPPSIRGLKTVRSFDNLDDLKKERELEGSNEWDRSIESNLASAKKTAPVVRGGDTSATRSSTIFSHRHYQLVCFVSLVLYLFLHLAIRIYRMFSTDAVCAYTLQSTPWMQQLNIFTAGGMVFATALQMNRLALTTFRESGDIGTKASYLACLCLIIIATIANISTLFDSWSGYCLDAFE